MGSNHHEDVKYSRKCYKIQCRACNLLHLCHGSNKLRVRAILLFVRSPAGSSANNTASLHYYVLHPFISMSHVKIHLYKVTANV
jgi:hypothetical protein